jgi:hypothetical protein
MTAIPAVSPVLHTRSVHNNLHSVTVAPQTVTLEGPGSGCAQWKIVGMEIVCYSMNGMEIVCCSMIGMEIVCFSLISLTLISCKGVKEQRNILHEISKRKANWIDHILCRNCLLQQVLEWKIKVGIEVTGRRRRRRRKLLDDLRERKGYSHLKEESLDRTMWRARFGRGFGPVSYRLLNEWMNERMSHEWQCQCDCVSEN